MYLNDGHAGIVFQLASIAQYQAPKCGAAPRIYTIKTDYVMFLTDRLRLGMKIRLLGPQLVGHIDVGNVQLERDDVCVLQRCNGF